MSKDRGSERAFLAQMSSNNSREDSEDFPFQWEFFKWTDTFFSDGDIVKIIEDFNLKKIDYPDTSGNNEMVNHKGS